MKSLNKITSPNYEVIVVDNASQGNTNKHDNVRGKHSRALYKVLPQNFRFLTNSSVTLSMEKSTPLIFVMSVQFVVKIFTVWFPYLGKVLILGEEVSEDEVQNACQQKWAEQRPEKAEGGILVALFSGCPRSGY